MLEKKEYAAYTIRPKIHRMLEEHLRPVERVELKRRYRGAAPEFHTEVTEKNVADLVASCEIDHTVKPSASFGGGRLEGEQRLGGTIHGYYRMYWGKKIIEWSASHEEALETMVYLHDKYPLDGRDRNTYANILWCFGLHDRPWRERDVFGMARYLSLGGMKRRTNVEAYLEEIRRLELTGEDPHRLQ
ncbi:MAG: hypothetical protein FJW20_18320 [Acidimicrobiia bacterium]|nr:hypothetical protein [Acidimicrobiia bacterium]